MVEIFNYPVTVSDRFAHDQQRIDEFERQFFLPARRPGAALPAILNLIPQHTAVSLLLGSFAQKSWVRFSVPPEYETMGQARSEIAPSLGDSEILDVQINRVKQVGEDERGARIVDLLGTVKTHNEMVNQVRLEMLRFLQG